MDINFVDVKILKQKSIIKMGFVKVIGIIFQLGFDIYDDLKGNDKQYY